MNICFLLADKESLVISETILKVIRRDNAVITAGNGCTLHIPFRRSVMDFFNPVIWLDCWALCGKYDMVIASTPIPSLMLGMLSRLRPKARIVILVRGLLFLRKGWYNRYLLRLEKFLYVGADRLITISHCMTQEFIRKRSDVLQTMPGSSNGIEIKRFLNDEPVVSEELREVLCVGRVTRDKGYGNIIKLAKARPHLNFTVVGPSEDKELLEALCGLQNVKWVDKTYLDATFYSRFDLFMHLSYREGFGNVIVEARLAGLPVIAWDIAGVRSSVGSNGVLLKVDDLFGLMKTLDNWDLVKEKTNLLESQIDAKRFSIENVEESWKRILNQHLV